MTSVNAQSQQQSTNSTSKEEFSQNIDRAQIAQQLQLLGYAPGEKVFLRAFFASDNPRSKTDSGRKADETSLESIAKTAKIFQDNGRGIYLVVNGGGHTDAEVKYCRAIFYEHDNLLKDIQLALWQSLGLPEPTFQIDTGGKSIHSYWVFQEPIPVDLWKKLQADLLNFASADRSLKNPSRVMRLAGGYHISSKGTHPTLIVSNSGVRYGYHQLREIIPATQKKSSPPTLPSKTLQNIASVPLTACLSRADRELVVSGVTEGGRNSSGAKLARNLIGTESRLQELGIQHNENARQLFNNYCNRCSPPLDIKEADQIWKKALLKNPTATLSDDAIFTCVNAWQKRQQMPDTQKAVANNKIVELSLRDCIAEIIDRGLTSSSEKQALLELAQQTKTHPKEIDNLADLVRHEIERDIYREETQKEVEQLIQPRTALNLTDYLPKGLAEPVMMWCKWLNIRPEVALSAILVTASTLHETGTELVIHRAQGFSVPSTLFMALVSPSGQKKSPIYKNLIAKALKGLKAEAKAKYESDLKQYEIEYQEWNNDKSVDKGSEPKKPVEPVFHFNAATGEGIQRLAQNCPMKALFMLVDEIEAMLNSSNQYRGGRGSDRQDILSYYDGAGQTTLRASGVSIDVDEIYISIFGGIQPEVLKTHTKDLKDIDGYWARFLFVNQQLAAAEMDDDTGGFDISELVGGYYRRVYALGKRTYTLSRSAFQIYRTVYNDLEQKRVSHPSPGMRNIYAKLEGQIGRLALNLHAIEEADKNSPADEISALTMRKAIALANFYLNEVTDLHADSNADKGELPALLAKLLEYANQKGSLTPRDAVTKFNAIKKSSEALDHFRELEVMGYGVVEKQKRNWVFIPIKNSCNGSRNERNGSRNGSRNDFFQEEPITSKHSESSRNERNERNDFWNFPQTVKEGQLSIVDENKTSPEIITPLRSLREVAEIPTEPMISPRNDSRNAPESNHYANDITAVGGAELIRQAIADTSWDMICNLTKKWSADFKAQVWGQLSLEERKSAKALKPDSSTALLEPVQLLQVEISGADISNFIGCQIEVRSLSDDIKFIGEMTNWDVAHGNITLITADGKEEVAHIRQSFLAG